ncbi:unnamed protein product [Porites evermanni]|uniref:Uncharacterized protein n=1 Tax=Porites evermanni TaxID=104178 RepID=A0ABN8LZD6_9CNID|nr:unnamed protein product [Porites evermanni]
MEARESKISEACLSIAQLVRLVTYTERELTDGRGGIVKTTFLWSSRLCCSYSPIWLINTITKLMESYYVLTDGRYNSTIRRRKGSLATYNTKKREPPVAVDTGLMVHAKTRKRELVDKLHNLENNPGETRKVTHICSDATTKTSISPLTEEYASVRPFVFPREKPEANVTFNDEMKALPVALDTNQSWLKHVSVVVEQSGDDESQATDVSWSVYHASKRSSHPQTDITFPLFREDSKSPAMVRHVIDVIRKAVEFLSPGQVPAIACDQPLYAITKLVQWNFPEFYGEPKLFAMFGGLHIESGAWKTLGDWLAESG